MTIITIKGDQCSNNIRQNINANDHLPSYTRPLSKYSPSLADWKTSVILKENKQISVYIIFI